MFTGSRSFLKFQRRQWIVSHITVKKIIICCFLSTTNMLKRRGINKSELCVTNCVWYENHLYWNLVLRAAGQGGLHSFLPSFKHTPILTHTLSSPNITDFSLSFCLCAEQKKRIKIRLTDYLKCNMNVKDFKLWWFTLNFIVLNTNNYGDPNKLGHVLC